MLLLLQDAQCQFTQQQERDQTRLRHKRAIAEKLVWSHIKNAEKLTIPEILR